jgi:hypothetical protein
MRSARLDLILLLLGKDGLQHISWLGDMREIDFGRNGLCSARSSRGRMAARAIELRTHFFGFIFLERTGVRLSRTDAELCQDIKNLAALDFQLSREIVDSNLTHPPLFEICPSPQLRIVTPSQWLVVEVPLSPESP